MGTLSQLYTTQISFTEWFSAIKHTQTDAMREEDNLKRERLRTLHELIGLPFDEPVQFSALDIANRTAPFQTYLQEHGNDPCALRLIPLRPNLPKLRMRGSSVRNVLIWFAEQKIVPSEYRADFVPHSEKPTWSTIFIVNQHGLFGEIIRGGHYQLTQGFYEKMQPVVFSYDFTRWILSHDNPEALAHLQEILGWITIAKDKQPEIVKVLLASFSNGLLEGYFETTSSEDCGLWFVDYNRILGKMYEEVKPAEINKIQSSENIISGYGASLGKISGKVRVVLADQIVNAQLNAGEILVTQMTTPLFVPLLQKAAAVITDLGGILTHAAIVSRELGIPCITGTIDATKKLKDGDLVEVDANNGVVRKL